MPECIVFYATVYIRCVALKMHNMYETERV